MSTGDEERKPKTSIEERVKSNVALWFLGAVAAGFSAGIGAVKWSDERYKVEPIPIAEKDAFVKAQSDLVALHYGYDLSAPIAFSVAKLLSQAGVAEFSQPMITQGEMPHRMTIYLAD
jgi:hypothetical protein